VVIEEGTREAGVRNLEREVGALKAARLLPRSWSGAKYGVLTTADHHR